MRKENTKVKLPLFMMEILGNPCKIIREITEEDRKYYYKDREFDVPIE